KAELGTAVAALDTNQDGVLDRSDHVDGAKKDGDALDLLLHPRAIGDDGAFAPLLINDALDTLFIRFDADTSGTIRVSALVAVFDRKAAHADLDTKLEAVFAAIDTNADQLLSRAEVQAALAGLDANHDGTLDRSDFGADGDAGMVT